MSTAQELIALAKDKLFAKDFPAADGLLQQALKSEPDNPSVYVQIGQAAYQRADNSAASAAFERAMGLDPQSVAAREGQIKLMLRQHRYDDARGIANDLVRMDPGNPKTLSVAAKAYFKASDYSSAARTWESIAQAKPSDLAPMIEAAKSYLRAGSPDQAKTVAEAAHKRFPKNSEALLIKANALDALEDFGGLGATLDELAAVDPQSALGFLPSLVSAGRPRMAANVIAKAREQNLHVEDTLRTTVVKALRRQARAAEQASDGDLAASHWQHVLLVDPENSEARSGLRRISQPAVEAARTALKEGQFSESREKFKEAVAIDPSNPRRWTDLAKVSEADEAWTEAADAWLRLAALSGDSVEVMTRACRTARKASDAEWALSVFVEAKKAGLGAETAEWGNSIARKVAKAARDGFKAGDRDETYRRLILLKRWRPDDELVQALAARVEKSLALDLKSAVAEDKLEAATELSEKLLAINPARVEALKHLAQVRLDREDYDAAATYYATLTQLRPDQDYLWSRFLKCLLLANQYERCENVAAEMERRFAGNDKVKDVVANVKRKVASKKA